MLHLADDLLGAIDPAIRIALADIGSGQHRQSLSLYIAHDPSRIAADGFEELHEYGQSLLEGAWGATSLLLQAFSTNSSHFPEWAVEISTAFSWAKPSASSTHNECAISLSASPSELSMRSPDHP